jgi:hypothetical protein
MMTSLMPFGTTASSMPSPATKRPASSLMAPESMKERITSSMKKGFPSELRTIRSITADGNPFALTHPATILRTRLLISVCYDRLKSGAKATVQLPGK